MLASGFRGDPAGLFDRMLASQPVDFAAYLEWEDLAVCCASPELFFRKRGRELLTRPMKGTAARRPGMIKFV